LFQHYFPPILN